MHGCVGASASSCLVYAGERIAESHDDLIRLDIHLTRAIVNLSNDCRVRRYFKLDMTWPSSEANRQSAPPVAHS